MVSRAISKDAYDLIKRNPSQPNQRSPESSQRSFRHECRPGTFPHLPDPLRETQEQRGGMAERNGAAKRTLLFLKRFVGNPEAYKHGFKFLNASLRPWFIPVPAGKRSRENKAGQRTSQGAGWLKPEPSCQSLQAAQCMDAGALCWTPEKRQGCLSGHSPQGSGTLWVASQGLISHRRVHQTVPRKLIILRLGLCASLSFATCFPYVHEDTRVSL